MKETGLMFKAPLVRAILEGRKTQTRRIVKPQPAPDKRFQGWILDSTDRKRIGKASWGHGTGGLVSDIECIGSTCGKPGDRIYVRETWRGVVNIAPPGSYEYAVAHYVPDQEHCRRVEYAATQEADGELWRPAIHMPKWAARIWLEITGVRVERLQDISEADALAEGARFELASIDSVRIGATASFLSGFRNIWESTGGDWDANPWVWAIDFKVLSTTGRPA